jgi:hypothetical protein
MNMNNTFPKATQYLNSINPDKADNLDKMAKKLVDDLSSYERASQALRRRFVRGALIVEGIDRGGRITKIKRDKDGGIFKYFIEGSDKSWSQPDERIWVVAMYALWQSSK